MTPDLDGIRLAGAWALCGLGGLAMLAAALACLRPGAILAQVHAASGALVWGAPLALAGAALAADSADVSVRIALLALGFLVLAPLVAALLAETAHGADVIAPNEGERS